MSVLLVAASQTVSFKFILPEHISDQNDCYILVVKYSVVVVPSLAYVFITTASTIISATVCSVTTDLYTTIHNHNYKFSTQPHKLRHLTAIIQLPNCCRVQSACKRQWLRKALQGCKWECVPERQLTLRVRTSSPNTCGTQSLTLLLSDKASALLITTSSTPSRYNQHDFLQMTPVGDCAPAISLRPPSSEQACHCRPTRLPPARPASWSRRPSAQTASGVGYVWTSLPPPSRRPRSAPPAESHAESTAARAARGSFRGSPPDGAASGRPPWRRSGRRRRTGAPPRPRRDPSDSCCAGGATRCRSAPRCRHHTPTGPGNNFITSRKFMPSLTPDKTVNLRQHCQSGCP